MTIQFNADEFDSASGYIFLRQLNIDNYKINVTVIKSNDNEWGYHLSCDRLADKNNAMFCCGRPYKSFEDCLNAMNEQLKLINL